MSCLVQVKFVTDDAQVNHTNITTIYKDNLWTSGLIKVEGSPSTLRGSYFGQHRESFIKGNIDNHYWIEIFFKYINTYRKQYKFEKHIL